jgi:serine/threonine protein kinase, bacterial
MPLSKGDVFAGYTVVRLLGAGGMGEVYLVEHPRLPRYDALKALPAELTVDREYRGRFIREAEMAARLWHPNIVGVHDRGEYNGQLWISMDFVEGSDAGQLLQSHNGQGLSPDLVVRIVSEVADALDYAHEQQLLHRDVKPSNILLAQPDSRPARALLADFGIARWAQDAGGLTATDMTVGTVAYAAPEQLLGDKLDGRADQYALAATAFHLLSGKQLFTHTNPAVVISQHLTATPPSITERVPELSGLGPAFERALAKKPDDRFASCTDFARALARGLGTTSDGQLPTDPTVSARVAHRPKSSRSRGLKFAGLATVVLAVLVGVALAIGLTVGRDTRSGAPATPSVSTPVQPVVLVGADCATLGAAGVTTTGKQAYCSRLSATGDQMWSIYQGPVPDPTAATPGPNDQVYPPGIEEQVRVCVTQTGQTRAQCRENVRQGNLVGPP